MSDFEIIDPRFRRYVLPNAPLQRLADGFGIETDYEGGKQKAELPPSVYRLDEDGTLALVADDFEGPNGMAFSPDGAQLGRIKTPAPVSNLAFGGRNRSRLFICASHSLYAVYTNQRGAARP